MTTINNYVLTCICFADSRKKMSKTKAKIDEFRKNLNELKINDNILCFTDGSCAKNPGHAGVGICAYQYSTINNTGKDLKDLNDLKDHNVEALTLTPCPCLVVSRPIGRATNNIAELYAIALACEKLLLFVPRPSKTPSSITSSESNRKIYIFTDSKYAIGLLTQNWTPKVNQDLVEYTKQKLLNLKCQMQCPVRILWAPGHSGIEENEFADNLATRATKYSQAHNCCSLSF